MLLASSVLHLLLSFTHIYSVMPPPSACSLLSLQSVITQVFPQLSEALFWFYSLPVAAGTNIWSCSVHVAAQCLHTLVCLFNAPHILLQISTKFLDKKKLSIFFPFFFFIYNVSNFGQLRRLDRNGNAFQHLRNKSGLTESEAKIEKGVFVGPKIHDEFKRKQKLAESAAWEEFSWQSQKHANESQNITEEAFSFHFTFSSPSILLWRWGPKHRLRQWT